MGQRVVAGSESSATSLLYSVAMGLISVLGVGACLITTLVVLPVLWRTLGPGSSVPGPESAPGPEKPLPDSTPVARHN